MRTTRFLTTVVASLCVGAAANAQTVIPYTVMQSGTGTGLTRTFVGLDGQGTSLTVNASASGLLQSIGGAPGVNSFPGLWFGGNNTTALYTFTFSTPVTFIEFLFTAHSNVNGHEELLDQFGLDAGTPLGVHTDIQGTTWDGLALRTTVNDGRAYLGFTRTGGGAFSSLTFRFVVVTGSPNGTVIEQMRYTTARNQNIVPEPGTYLLLGSGLIGLGVVARRRNRTL